MSDGAKLARLELSRNMVHLRVVPPAVGIGDHLGVEIARPQAGQPGNAVAIAATVEPVTGEAGIGGTASRTAQRNHLACPGKGVTRRRLPVGAAGEDREQAGERGWRKKGPPGGLNSHGPGTSATARCSEAETFSRAEEEEIALAGRVLPILLVLSACKPPPDEDQFLPGADPARGREIVQRVGCGSCHHLPGTAWPEGNVGPSLDGFGSRSLIAGRLPNRPDLLRRFVRDAPSVLPGSTMPPIPMTEEEARNVAAWLYTLEHE